MHAMPGLPILHSRDLVNRRIIGYAFNRLDLGPDLHDLSVLFDDDRKIYAVYGAGTIRIVELNPDVTAVVPGTDLRSAGRRGDCRAGHRKAGVAELR
jgi:beta-xylosidase